MSRLLVTLFLAAAAAAPAAEPVSFGPDDVSRLQSMLDDIAHSISENYYPTAKVDRAFDERVTATKKLLARVKSNDEANAVIADMLSVLDPRIRFYPPRRNVRVDYGWDWRIVGPDAYVSHLDADGEALKQGLKLGDKILSINGNPLTRESSEQLFYAIYILGPLPGLVVQAQSPGDAPRELAIRSTLRPQRKVQDYRKGNQIVIGRVLTELEFQRRKEFFDLNTHLHRVGPVLVWRAEELRREIDSVADGIKAARQAEALILDLRGQDVGRYETALRLLDGLFPNTFEIGQVEQQGAAQRLRVSGGTGAFTGTLLVLIDAETGNYAELVAHVIAQKQRGVLIGDRTTGQAFEFRNVSYVRGQLHDFNVSAIKVPEGEFRLADGYVLDGQGVAPDLQLAPKPADLAAHRDVVLARALAMLKQSVSPEDAYKFFRTDPDDDEAF